MLHKKAIFFGVLVLFFGRFCFSQELQVVNTVYNGKILDSEPDSQYPQDPQVKGQWDKLFKSYDLERIERDAFNNNDLWSRIAGLSRKSVDAGSGEAYSVFLTMEGRRFICLLRWSNDRQDYAWHWIYEIKS
jgi:hypothetical protein